MLHGSKTILYVANDEMRSAIFNRSMQGIDRTVSALVCKVPFVAKSKFKENVTGEKLHYTAAYSCGMNVTECPICLQLRSDEDLLIAFVHFGSRGRQRL
jgi:hypothetical protein